MVKNNEFGSRSVERQKEIDSLKSMVNRADKEIHELNSKLNNNAEKNNKTIEN